MSDLTLFLTGILIGIFVPKIITEIIILLKKREVQE